VNGKITVVGLGAGNWQYLTLGAMDALEYASRLFLRTEKHPVVDYIKTKGIHYKSFDNLYNEEQTFEEVYSHIVELLIEEANKGDVVYGVPGSPAVAETSVSMLIDSAKIKGIKMEIIPGISFLETIYTRLNIDPVKGMQIIDGLQLNDIRIDTCRGCIVTQVYDRLVAGEVKLFFMRYYPDEHPIYIIKAAGVDKREMIKEIPLYQLDRQTFIDYLTSVYIPPLVKRRYDIQDLLDIMEKLRGENGCPWDREQDSQSLKPYLLEETYEVLEAIEKEDIRLMKEELGDLLLQVVFHSQIASETGDFHFSEVVDGICEKLINRHPHVFGLIKAKDSDGAIKSWEATKRKEKGINNYTKTLEEIPRILPSLIRSYKVQQKAALAGFDWEDIEEVMEKVKEEVLELEEVYKSEEMNRIKEEIGDLLFAVVNLARFKNIRPELALRETIEKFIRRFKFIEDNSHKMGKTMDQMTLNEMEMLWQMAKTHNFN